jgi:hypothetical protein
MPPPGGGGMPPQGGQPGGEGVPPQQQGGQQDGGFQTPGQGPLSWQQVIQAVQRGNPGAPPNVLMSAVNRALPIMTADSQQQWRIMQEQIRMLAVTQKPQIVETQQAGANQRAAGAQAGANYRAGVAADTRKATAGGTTGEALRRFLDDKPDATPTEISEYLRSLKPQTATEQKIQQHGQDIQGVITQIDSALGSIDEAQHGGSPVTGLGGAVQRMYEFGAGALGMDDSTKASDFQTKIRMIQAQLPRAMMNVGKIGKDEREHLDEVVRGLGRFTNAAQAKSALEYVKTVLQSKIQQQGQGGQPRPQGGGGAAKPKDEGFDRAAAKKAGWSDKEIDDYLRTSDHGR